MCYILERDKWWSWYAFWISYSFVLEYLAVSRSNVVIILHKFMIDARVVVPLQHVSCKKRFVGGNSSSNHHSMDVTPRQQKWFLAIAPSRRCTVRIKTMLLLVIFICGCNIWLSTLHDQVFLQIKSKVRLNAPICIRIICLV